MKKKNRYIFLFINFLLIGLASAQFVPFSFWKVAVSLGAFSISGVHGTTDSTADAWLVNDTNPTIIFTSSNNATSYDVVIKDSTGTSTICSSLGTASSPAAVTGCSLVNGTSYRVYVTAKLGGATRVASNEPFSFTVDNTTPTANTITGITGASDATADTWLVGGLVPTLNWNAFTGASTYDVTIKDSAGSATICATQNTASTSYTFTGCNLVNGTDYKAYVTAKSASDFNVTNASNNGLTFSVDTTVPGAFSITGITGGTDVTVDAFLANGLDPSVNFGASANVYNYDVVIKDSAGSATICSNLNQASSPVAVTCSLTNGQSYKAYVTAKSISSFNTTAATNNGFSFTVGAPVASPPGSFLITGATGSSDTTADSWLTVGTTVTANWNSAPGATSYDVTIRNSTDTVDVCVTQNTASTSYTFTGCALTVNSIYKIKVTAKNSLSTNATNDGFNFQVVNRKPGYSTISGITGGTDISTDSYLLDGNIATVAWSAVSGASSYDVTIRNSTDTADVCATQNTAATSYTFTGCMLTSNTQYLVRVITNNALGATEAINSPYSFLVPGVTTFCPTVTSTSKAGFFQSNLYPANPGYSNSQSCNYTITPPGSNYYIELHFNVFGSADSGDQLTIYDGTSTGGINLGNFKGTTTPPPDQVANSGSFFMTWVSNGSGQSTGYQGYYYGVYYVAQSFSITGITGGSDVTLDSTLTDNSSGVTINWNPSTNATSYNVVIRNGNGFQEICSRQSTTVTSLNIPSCTLMPGATYQVTVYALNSTGIVTQATLSPYNFTYDISPNNFTITGITGGTDSTADDTLANGNLATVNWSASANVTSYDVTIYENDGYTVKCPTQNVASGTTSYNFSACSLTLLTLYKAEVIAKNANGSKLATNSLFSFFSGAAWVPTSLTNTPGARYLHSAVWTGSEMIIWGGTPGALGLDTGARYNPTTDSWSALPASGLTGVFSHSAVWTGTEMIVWGGNTGSATYSNSGSKYNPSSNTWLAISTSAPTARFNHKAVWTGTEMIVWGGQAAGATFFNTGGRYNPSTNTWVATNTTGAPSARSFCVAVWTGTEMIVWGGGTNAPSYTNTGGRYNPTTDTWTTTSVGANVPTARFSATAIWTGTEMIVWGGINNSTFYNNGGKYNPSTNSWSTVSTGTNVPAVRTNHSAVWTDTEMIVWGGYNIGPVYQNTGGRYNPTTDTWLATSTGANVPSARESPSAVWTGSKMIIWGGMGSSGTLNTGGVYTPF